jgi:hypothetical protein
MCRVLVDAESRLAITAELFSGSDDTGRWETEHPYPSGRGRDVPGKYEARAWPGFARALVMCEDSGTMQPLNISVESNHPSDPEESQEVLAELIQPLAEALSFHCPEGTSAQAD